MQLKRCFNNQSLRTIWTSVSRFLGHEESLPHTVVWHMWIYSLLQMFCIVFIFLLKIVCSIEHGLLQRKYMHMTGQVHVDRIVELRRTKIWTHIPYFPRGCQSGSGVARTGQEPSDSEQGQVGRPPQGLAGEVNGERRGGWRCRRRRFKFVI
jgi:hypothetical protein